MSQEQYLETIVKQRRKLEQEKYSTDLFAFLREVLGYTDIQEKPHREVINILLAPQRYKLILLPRGSFKTSICSIGFPLWRLTQDPNYRILLDSKTLDRSRMILGEIKFHIEHNEKFRDIFGDWKQVPGYQEGNFIVPTRTKALKEASIETGGVDSPKTGGHYDLIVADDLHDEKNVDTELMRRRVTLHYKTLHPILEPDGEMVVVGTRWHHDDTYSYILKHEQITLQ